jgi:hypothetical protein
VCVCVCVCNSNFAEVYQCKPKGKICQEHPTTRRKEILIFVTEQAMTLMMPF